MKIMHWNIRWNESKRTECSNKNKYIIKKSSNIHLKEQYCNHYYYIIMRKTKPIKRSEFSNFLHTYGHIYLKLKIIIKWLIVFVCLMSKYIIILMPIYTFFCILFCSISLLFSVSFKLIWFWFKVNILIFYVYLCLYKLSFTDHLLYTVY